MLYVYILVYISRVVYSGVNEETEREALKLLRSQLNALHTFCKGAPPVLENPVRPQAKTGNTPAAGASSWRSTSSAINTLAGWSNTPGIAYCTKYKGNEGQL